MLRVTLQAPGMRKGAAEDCSWNGRPVQPALFETSGCSCRIRSTDSVMQHATRIAFHKLSGSMHVRHTRLQALVEQVANT